MEKFLSEGRVAELWSRIKSLLGVHTGNQMLHITAAERTAWNSKIGKSHKASLVIPTNWTGSTKPYTQTIPLNGVSTTSVVEISLDSTAPSTQATAYQALMLQDGGQAAGSITLKSYGVKNTANIPIIAIIRGDL